MPGLKRSELAGLAGISVEYLIRIEQGRDHNPSVSVVNALADALRLDAAERDHLRNVASCSAGPCTAAVQSPRLEVRPTVRALLAQLEPGIAYVTNRLGDLPAYTDGFDLLARPAGVLDGLFPNLTRFVFADERARRVFPDWERLADELTLPLSFGAPSERSQRLVADLTATAGDDFTRRLRGHSRPRGDRQVWCHPAVGTLRFDRETLELPAADAQQLVVLLPADAETNAALNRLRHGGGLALVR